MIIVDDTTANQSTGTISVAPATPMIGADVSGMDLAGVDDTTRPDVESAFAANSVLFFLDRDLSPEAQQALGRRFGDLHVHPAAKALEGHRNR